MGWRKLTEGRGEAEVMWACEGEVVMWVCEEEVWGGGS